MCTARVDQVTFENEIQHFIRSFLIDRQSQGVSHRTIRAYSQELAYISSYLQDELGITTIDAISAPDVRSYIIHLQQRGRNPGGCHIAYRVTKTFFRWLEEETDGAWRSPMRKIHAPKLVEKILDPITIQDVEALVDATSGPLELRDKAILYCLLDTGCRAEEFVSIDLDDVDTATGQVMVRKGKGGKERAVFLGRKSRKALRAYLRSRQDNHRALWVTDEGSRLTYAGLRQVVRRLSDRAGIPTPSLHSFRRAFTIEMIRAGTNLLTMQRLLGHADMQVLKRYAKLTEGDLMVAHQDGSPVDHKVR